METENIETLLKQARPAQLPRSWKQQILEQAMQQKPQAALPRLAWCSLAACWALVVLLHQLTPEVPRGNQRFDHAAYASRAAEIQQLIAGSEMEKEQPEKIQLDFRLPLPRPVSSPTPHI